MTFEELCDFVASELERNPKRRFGKIFNKEPYKSTLEDVFPMMPQNIYFNQACVTLLIQKQQHPPICRLDGCDNYVNYMGGKFNDYCSNRCSAIQTTNDPAVQGKQKQTNLKKYGVEHPAQSDIVKKKAKKTNLERYGYESPLGNKDIRNKIEKTNLERYGVISTLSLPNVQDEIKQTNLERYGHVNPLGSPEIRNKIEQTNLERYGHENPLSNPDIQDKVKKTNLERYGHENPLGNSDIQDKVKKTNLERYGHESPFGNSDIQDKVKKTNLERYGAENVMKNSDIQNKAKKTNLERYGYESPLGSKDIRNKIEKTNLERYGVISTLSLPNVQDEIKQTNLERYGHENPFGNKEVRDKIKQTNLERYGHESPMGSPDIQDKTKKTNLEKYGTEFSNQSHIQNIHILQDPILLEQAIHEYRTAGVAELCNCDSSTIYDHVKKHNITLPTYPNSYWETELAEYLDSLIISYELNTRKIISPYELDFYLPDYKLAIELNGTYWHSDKFRDKKYHYTKWKACHDQGIQLIQIWDTDWKKTKDIWKSRLQYITGKSSKTIYARKCSIEIIKPKDAKEFYDQNHIQGFTGASYHLGLYHDDELVSAMSFGKTRATKDTEIELVRFCSKLGYQVTGAASKLLKAYQKQNPHTIISFSDNMYSDGGLYETLGFTKNYDLSPDYTYMKNNQRYHKQAFTKASIQKKFGISDDDIKTKTEFQLMDEFGYVRIYDAGKIKWIL